MSPRPMTRQLIAGETFGARFVAEFSKMGLEAIEKDYGVRRCRAIRVLRGIPWRFIPTERCGRARIVGLKGLFLLCNCLDVVNDDVLRNNPDLLMASIAASLGATS